MALNNHYDQSPSPNGKPKQKPILQSYIPMNQVEFESLDEALDTLRQYNLIHPENIYFIDGKKPDFQDLAVSRKIMTSRDFHPERSLEDFLLQHKNDILRFYFGSEAE